MSNKTIVTNIASASAGGIEIRLGSVDGKLLGNLFNSDWWTLK
jgi:hypothetical protein